MKGVHILSGPDRSGKSSVGEMLSKITGIPYFKFARDKEALQGTDMSTQMLKYCDPYFVDFLSQTEHSVIIDRHYESEWVYGNVLGRTVDEESIWKVDELFSEIPATFLIFKRPSYVGVSDDDPRLDQETLEKLSRKYDEFAARTKCKVHAFEFDSYDLGKMTETVLKKLGK